MGSATPQSEASSTLPPRFTVRPGISLASAPASMISRDSELSSAAARSWALRARSVWPVACAADVASRKVAQALAVRPIFS